MNKKRAQLAARRADLLSRAEQQRVALRRSVAPWRLRLSLADRGIAALRYAKRHPRYVVGGVILLALSRPVRALHWLQRGLIGWQLVRSLKADRR